MAESIAERIADAIADYRTVFPEPYGLAPNLQLASEAAAELYELRRQLKEALAQVGLPESADLSTLITHHRANAALAAAMESLTIQGTGAEPLSDGEWREFQNIPDQGYSHRHWVDHKIALRVSAAAAVEKD